MEKRRIAEAAVGFIEEEMAIAMDSGTTVEAICECLVDKRSVHALDIVSHSLKVAMKLGEYYRVSMPGGVMMSRYNALVGMDVENFYQKINVDIAFLGTTGINNCNGLTVSDPLQLEVKKRCVQCAAKRIAVVNSSKYIRRGIYEFCDFSEIDTLITVKTEENATQLEQIAKKGVNIVLV
jgi:DeoR/GlpR family transcriptional regulator of sugar metabolism